MSVIFYDVSLDELDVEAGNGSGFESESSIYCFSSGLDTDSDFEEKPKEVSQKTDKGLRITTLVSYLCIGLLIVTGFYAILGFFIDYYLKKQVNDLGAATQVISINQQDISTCSSKSYLMSDLVCDDVTNTKACFFDGGDCCLEHKETIYCTDCLCRHDANNISGLSIPVDNSTLVFKLSNNHVQNGGLYFPVLLFKLVHGPDTCNKLCFDDLNDTSVANGWLFQSVSLTCQCIYMESTDFCVEKAITEDDNLEDINILAVYKDSAMPIYNCHEMIMIELGDSDSSFLMVSPEKKCHGNFSQPLPKLESPTVTLVDSDSILFCGGRIEGTMSSKCYFVEDNFLTKEAGIMLEDNLLFTGGKDEQDTVRAISQYISINGNQEDNERGPDMMFALSDHCFERITHNKAIIIGGTRQDSENSNRTLVFHYVNSTHQSWTPGPKMLVPRTKQSCGVIHIQESKRRLLMVAAGVTPGLMFPTIMDHSTEIMIVSEDDIENARFASGPDIPVMDDIHVTEIVVSFDHHSLFLVATLSQGMAVFQFNVHHFDWMYLPAVSSQLNPNFGDFFALFIPSSGNMDSCEFLEEDQSLPSGPPQNWIVKESLIWRQVGNAWYYFDSNHIKQTWEHALTFCLSMNASLPEIRNGKDHEELIARSRMLGVQAFWIGIIKDPISKRIMYLSDGAKLNLTEYLPKDFTDPDYQSLLMVDTMTGMWQAKPDSLVFNVVCQSGLGPNLAIKNISETIQTQDNNDTCCDVISLERTGPYLFNNYIFGRYKRTVRSLSGIWSYIFLGNYEQRFTRHYEDEQVHQDYPLGFPNLEYNPKYTVCILVPFHEEGPVPKCWEDEGHFKYRRSGADQTCDPSEPVDLYEDSLSCSQHENDKNTYN